MRETAAPVGTELPPFNFGINLDDPAPYEREFDRVADSHAGWVRLWLWWRWTEPEPGRFQWAGFDAQVAWARARGLRIMASFAWMPGWANGTDPNCDFWAGGCQRPPNGDAYTNFVRAAVNRYKDDIKFWGLWNEPNLPIFWGGTRMQFTDRILRPGIQTIRAIDPTAKIVGPDLAEANPPWYQAYNPFYNADHDYPPDWRAWIDGIMHSDVGPQLDVISHHTYKNRAGDENAAMDRFHDHLGGLNGRQVWLTETAFNSCGDGHDETLQWVEIVNLVTGMRNRAWWNNTIYFQIADGPEDRSHGSCKSLTGPRPGLAPRPALLNLPALLGAGPPRNPGYSASLPAAVTELRVRVAEAVGTDGFDARRTEYVWSYYFSQIIGDTSPDLGVALYGARAADPRDGAGEMRFDEWWEVVHDFVRLPYAGPVPVVAPVSVPVTVKEAGTGCDDGYCVWVTGWGFGAAMEIVVRRRSDWHEFHTYRGGELNLVLATDPQSISLRLQSDQERQALRASGLILTVFNPTTGTWDNHDVPRLR